MLVPINHLKEVLELVLLQLPQFMGLTHLVGLVLPRELPLDQEQEREPD